MSGALLALHLVLAVPSVGPGRLAPPLDPGPFQPLELAASSAGVLLGDALVVAGGYGALQLFASGAIAPTAPNFRSAAYVLAAATILVPPLTAVLFGRWARAEPADGATWKALLLAVAGQALALGAGWAAYPRFWVVLPAQVLIVPLATTLGLHWGSRSANAARAARSEPKDPAPAASPARAGICPDPALGLASAG